DTKTKSNTVALHPQFVFSRLLFSCLSRLSWFPPLSIERHTRRFFPGIRIQVRFLTMPAVVQIRNVFWLAVWSLASRELVRFFRQRTRVIGALGQPVLFWALFGAG